jgi:hypothetical protein
MEREAVGSVVKRLGVDIDVIVYPKEDGRRVRDGDTWMALRLWLG